MSLWGVQLAIGKLVTDEGFRRRFQARPADAVGELRARGVALDDREIAALVATDRQFWSEAAARLDRNLRAPVPHNRPPTPALTPREREVLLAVVEGLSNKQIADRAGVSESAVKATLQQVFRKTGVRTRAQLVRIAIEGAIIP